MRMRFVPGSPSEAPTSGERRECCQHPRAELAYRSIAQSPGLSMFQTGWKGDRGSRSSSFYRAVKFHSKNHSNGGEVVYCCSAICYDNDCIYLKEWKGVFNTIPSARDSKMSKQSAGGRRPHRTSGDTWRNRCGSPWTLACSQVPENPAQNVVSKGGD